MTPQSPSKEAPWDLTLTQFSQSPSAAPSYFPESHWQSEISSLSKVILVLGKAWSYTAPTLGCRGLSHLMIWCFGKKLCIRRDAWVCRLLWWSCQSPVSHSCGLLNHYNSFCRGMFKLNAKFDADLLLYSLSHFECKSHTVHVLSQWHLPLPLTSTVKLSLFMHVHSSPLSLAVMLNGCCANCSHYITNGWTFSRETSRDGKKLC